MAANIKAEEIAPLVKELRSAWRSGRARPVEHRRAQLLQLQKMLEEHYDEWIEVQKKDFRKDFGAYNDLQVTLYSVKEQLRTLDEQVKPRPAEKTTIITLGSTTQLIPEPFGVVAIFATWNYPINISLLPVIGAIAAGNCVILKPSEISAHTSDLYAKLWPLYMDQKCHRVCTGPASIAQAILEVKLDFVFYTGSTEVGRQVYEKAAKHLTPVVLELGGKSPVYVHSDADIESTASRLVMAKTGNCGQICVAPDYVLAHESIMEPLVTALIKYFKKFYGEDASKSNDYDQIVSKRHINRLAGLLKNQTIHYGGRFDEETRFFEPTIIVLHDRRLPAFTFVGCCRCS